MQFQSTSNLFAEVHHICKWHVYCDYIFEGLLYEMAIQFNSGVWFANGIEAEVGLNEDSINV